MEPQPSRSEQAGFLVTNTIKLGGLAIALIEVLARPEIRPGALAISALMMAGAQSLESFFQAFFRR